MKESFFIPVDISSDQDSEHTAEIYWHNGKANHMFCCWLTKYVYTDISQDLVDPFY